MDILQESGTLFLGSRLKRLGEQMQAGAARAIADAGLNTQPTHMPLLLALDGQSLSVNQLAQALGASQPGVTRSVGQLVAMGLVETAPGRDQRHRLVSLTAAGSTALARAKHHVFPRVATAVDQLLAGDAAALLATLARVEEALAVTPLDALAARVATPALTILDFTDELAPLFGEINAEWITAMFRLEETDRRVLDQPRASIVDPGGAILFVAAEGLGVVGTCALQKTGTNSFELTKMGVRPFARGLKVGEFLLTTAIARAATLGADPLYLLTSRRCAAAIHLYEKLGFHHDAAIMARYGARYARCDVAMRYVAAPVSG